MKIWISNFEFGLVDGISWLDMASPNGFLSVTSQLHSEVLRARHLLIQKTYPTCLQSATNYRKQQLTRPQAKVTGSYIEQVVLGNNKLMTYLLHRVESHRPGLIGSWLCPPGHQRSVPSCSTSQLQLAAPTSRSWHLVGNNGILPCTEARSYLLSLSIITHVSCNIFIIHMIE